MLLIKLALLLLDRLDEDGDDARVVDRPRVDAVVSILTISGRTLATSSAMRPDFTEVVDGAWSVQDRHNLSFRDSLIVSAALLSGCRYLLTEDLNDGQEIDGLRVVDPFAHPPDSLEP